MEKNPILPVMPLDTVLFPGHTVPLKIFEDRYLKLIEECETTGKRKFIIALISSGREVGEDATPFRVGTEIYYTNIIQSNGLSFLTPTGIRRVYMNNFIRGERPYLLAEYSHFGDESEEILDLESDINDIEKKLSHMWISGSNVHSKEAYSKLLLKKETLSRENFILYLCGSIDIPIINQQHLLESKSGNYRVKNLLHLLFAKLKTEGKDAI